MGRSGSKAVPERGELGPDEVSFVVVAAARVGGEGLGRRLGDETGMGREPDRM